MVTIFKRWKKKKERKKIKSKTENQTKNPKQNLLSGGKRSGTAQPAADQLGLQVARGNANPREEPRGLRGELRGAASGDGEEGSPEPRGQRPLIPRLKTDLSLPGCFVRPEMNGAAAGAFQVPAGSAPRARRSGGAGGEMEPAPGVHPAVRGARAGGSRRGHLFVAPDERKTIATVRIYHAVPASKAFLIVRWVCFSRA